MTQKEAIKKAIEFLEKAIDTFPDKDDEIREYNDKLDKMIEELRQFIK
jgi:prefoldin subunit 5